jgi:hypothetical protein
MVCESYPSKVSIEDCCVWLENESDILTFKSALSKIKISTIQNLEFEVCKSLRDQNEFNVFLNRFLNLKKLYIIFN